jgi:hypothetical protein
VRDERAVVEEGEGFAVPVSPSIPRAFGAGGPEVQWAQCQGRGSCKGPVLEGNGSRGFVLSFCRPWHMTHVKVWVAWVCRGSEGDGCIGRSTPARQDEL